MRKYLNNGIGTIVFVVLAAITALLVMGELRGDIKHTAALAEENKKKIEKRVRIPRYNTDQLIMRDWLKRVEGKLDEALK
jgi:cell division protein ZapA (FtsZ GTPase activity inhibitor)